MSNDNERARMERERRGNYGEWLAVQAQADSEARKLIARGYMRAYVAKHLADMPNSSEEVAMTSMHLGGYLQAEGWLPYWLVDAVRSLVEAGVAWEEVQDAFRRGPRSVDQLFGRYGVQVPRVEAEGG